jgi:hypothetical protein
MYLIDTPSPFAPLGEVLAFLHDIRNLPADRPEVRDARQQAEAALRQHAATPLRVLVCGGRDFSDADFLNAELDHLYGLRRFTALIEGDAIGADRMAGEWAGRRGVEHVRFVADWKRFGSKAGPKRNRRMLDEGKPDLVVAFAGGHGTAHMVRIARAAGLPVLAPRRSAG